MKNAKLNKTRLPEKAHLIIAVLFSGLCWYLSYGLNGNYFYLLWIAPFPILFISFNVSQKISFLISFFAYLIGRLSWFSYLVTVATIVPAIIFTLALPLIFALIVILTRKAVIKIGNWSAVFCFPVFFTCFEYLLILFSADGSAGSIAYSQSNVLPLIQIASITGILGITFVVTLIPSAMAISWYFRREKKQFRFATGISLLIIASVFVYGLIRVRKDIQQESITVGMTVLDEKLHNTDNHPDFKKETGITEAYVKEISKLAGQGAQLVVLPERAINVSKTNETDIIGMLGLSARTNHVFIVTGYTNFRNEYQRNSSLVINDKGIVVMDYNKTHLVKGLEEQFTPGSHLGLFKFNDVQAATAICKDLDFPGYIQKYGLHEVGFLCIPAWDFIKDDWLHSRMAILRGVENGFAEIRPARLGRLTISDRYGRVPFEASSSTKKAASLIGKVPIAKSNTLYTRFGNWFAILNVIYTAAFIFLSVSKLKSRQAIDPMPVKK